MARVTNKLPWDDEARRRLGLATQASGRPFARGDSIFRRPGECSGDVVLWVAKIPQPGKRLIFRRHRPHSSTMFHVVLIVVGSEKPMRSIFESVCGLREPRS